MTQLLAAIRDVLKRDHVTFAELSQLDSFCGDLQLLVNHDKVSNIVIWSGMSQEAVDALEVIRKEGEYKLISTPVLTYLIDGAAPNLPYRQESTPLQEAALVTGPASQEEMTRVRGLRWTSTYERDIVAGNGPEPIT